MALQRLCHDQLRHHYEFIEIIEFQIFDGKKLSDLSCNSVKTEDVDCVHFFDSVCDLFELPGNFDLDGFPMFVDVANQYKFLLGYSVDVINGESVRVGNHYQIIFAGDKFGIAERTGVSLLGYIENYKVLVLVAGVGQLATSDDPGVDIILDH